MKKILIEIDGGMKYDVLVDWKMFHELPIVRYIQSLPAKGQKRVLIGVAGPGGSGKSSFCALLKSMFGESCVTISMDGYHFPNKELKKRNIYSIKGRPQTINRSKLVHDLRRLRDDPRSDLWFPVYDRQLHNPVENTIRVCPIHQIVLVEGLYLLQWTEVAQLFDYTVFLNITLPEMRRRLIERKVSQGYSITEAEKRLVNDMQTWKELQDCARKANLVLNTEGSSQSSDYFLYRNSGRPSL